MLDWNLFNDFFEKLKDVIGSFEVCLVVFHQCLPPLAFDDAPEPFNRIELAAVGWKEDDLNVEMLLKISPYLSTMVDWEVVKH